MVQGSSAVRTIDITYSNHALALRTARAELAVAARAEIKSRLDGIFTLRADVTARLPQEEVKNDSQSVGNNNGHDRPKRRAHPTSFRVAVYVADEQQVAGAGKTGPQAQQRSPPRRRSTRMSPQRRIEEDLGDDKCDSRERPRPQRNNLDLRRQSSLRFVSYLHKFVLLVCAITATARRCW